MRYASTNYTPASNWMTVALLTIVMIGFGLFADARSNTITANSTTGIAHIAKEIQS